MQRRLKNLSFVDVILFLIPVVIAYMVLRGTIATISTNHYSTREWMNFAILGIAQGSLYALIAIGYTLVYGVLFMINFAHGEFFMSGILTATIFIAWPLENAGFLQKHPIIGLLLVLIVAMAISILIAVVTERIAYKPLRKAPRLVPLITAIGASFFWQYAFRGLFGSEPKPFPQLEILKGTYDILGQAVLKVHVVVFVVTAIALVGLYVFVMYSKTGIAIRAVAENKDVAALMGIDVDRTISITFALGAAMAGIAGLLYALVFRQVHFYMGFIPGIKAFTAAVLGGIGSIPGAALGGLFLGFIESVGPPLFLEGLGIPAYYQLADVISFTLLVLVLIFRPQGILGERLAKQKA